MCSSLHAPWSKVTQWSHSHWVNVPSPAFSYEGGEKKMKTSDPLIKANTVLCMRRNWRTASVWSQHWTRVTWVMARSGRYDSLSLELWHWSVMPQGCSRSQWVAWSMYWWWERSSQTLCLPATGTVQGQHNLGWGERKCKWWMSPTLRMQLGLPRSSIRLCKPHQRISLNTRVELGFKKMKMVHDGHLLVDDCTAGAAEPQTSSWGTCLILLSSLCQYEAGPHRRRLLIKTSLTTHFQCLQPMLKEVKHREPMERKPVEAPAVRTGQLWACASLCRSLGRPPESGENVWSKGIYFLCGAGLLKSSLLRTYYTRSIREL